MRRRLDALAVRLDRFAGWPALLIWLLVIFGLSSIPNNFQESDSPIPADKIAHGVEFAVLAFIAVRTAMRRVGLGALPAALVAVAFSTAYGITDELHQKFVPGRDVSLTDLAADFVGSVVGTLVGLWLVPLDRGVAPTDVGHRS